MVISLPFQIKNLIAPQLLQLSTRIVIACFACLVEGIFISVNVALPKDHLFYYAGAIVGWATYLCLLRFKSSKIGAEIGDLYFLDAVLWTVAALLYKNGISLPGGWYLTVTLMFMRMIRIYSWQGTVTHDHGWPVFGFLGYKNKIQQGKSTISPPKYAMLRALGLAIIASVAFSFFFKTLDDGWRVGVVWALGVGFLIVAGPAQLRALAL